MRQNHRLSNTPIHHKALQQMQGRLVDLSGRLEAMLGDYSLYVDGAMADVTANYLVSLQRDFELALEQGEPYRLQPILEDINELHHDTALRIRQARRATLSD